MIHFSVIIVSWNAKTLLEEFLPSVLQTDYPKFEIILADNNSSDESVDWVTKNFPQVKIVRHSSNYGYAGGNNKATSVAQGEVLIFLNNDVQVDKSWLQELNSFMEDSPQYGIIQPKLRSYREPQKFEYAGAAGGFIDWLGYPFCRGRLFDDTEFDNGQYDRSSPIFWASGAAFAIKKSLFSDLNGFDELFEFHLEEIDLCWRAWQCGIPIGYAPKSIVYHLGGGSLPVKSYRKVFYNFRNSLIMLHKNLPEKTFTILFLRLLLDGIAGLRFLTQGHLSSVFAIVHAHFSYYRIMLTKNKVLLRVPKKLRKPLPDGIIFKKSIIWSYFLQRKITFAQLWPEHK